MLKRTIYNLVLHICANGGVQLIALAWVATSWIWTRTTGHKPFVNGSLKWSVDTVNMREHQLDKWFDYLSTPGVQTCVQQFLRADLYIII